MMTRTRSLNAALILCRRRMSSTVCLQLKFVKLRSLVVDASKTNHWTALPEDRLDDLMFNIEQMSKTERHEYILGELASSLGKSKT